jgi:hypothetical protein
MFSGIRGTKDGFLQSFIRENQSLESDNLCGHGIKDFDYYTDAPQSNRYTVGSRRGLLFHTLSQVLRLLFLRKLQIISKFVTSLHKYTQ